MTRRALHLPTRSSCTCCWSDNNGRNPDYADNPARLRAHPSMEQTCSEGFGEAMQIFTALIFDAAMADYTFEISWRRAERAAPPLDLLRLVDQRFSVKSIRTHNRERQ
jgi:hypothetical protein